MFGLVLYVRAKEMQMYLQGIRAEGYTQSTVVIFTTIYY